MIFHITYSIRPENRNAAQERFLKTGGPPPDGAKMLGRWHSASGLTGFTVVETSDATSIAKWTQDWTDHISFEVTPVLEDEQFSQVIAR